MHSRFFFYCCLLLPFLLPAQAQLGYRPDPHAGINGTFLQPAAGVRTPYGLDVNLVHFSLGGSNNYAYLTDISAAQLLRTDPDRISFEEEELVGQADVPAGETLIGYGFFSGSRRRHFFVSADVLGPAFSVAVGENLRLGAFTRFRTEISGFGVDGEFSFTPYDGRAFGTTFPADLGRGGGAAWAEIGIHASHRIEAAAGDWSVGANLRYLVPFEAGYFIGETEFPFTKVNNTTIGGSGFAIETAVSNDWSTEEDYQLRAKGNGFGIDLGVQYAFLPDNNDGYRATLGLSLLDIGLLHLDQSSRQDRFATADRTLVSTDNYEQPEGEFRLNRTIARFSTDVYGDSTASLVARDFTLGLPTRVSLQFDYAFTGLVHLSTIYSGPVPVSRTAARLGSPHRLAVVPRLQHWWGGLAFPVTIEQWQRIQVGTALRIGPLTLGTDRLFGTLLPRNRWAGADFYIGLKFHSLGTARNSKRGRTDRGGRARGREVKCYRF